MKIITAQKEKNLAELAQRLFKAEVGDAKAVERNAIAALRKANPQLGPRATLTPGAPIVVPEVEGATSRPAAERGFVLSTGAADLKAGLAQASDAVEDAWTERLKIEDALTRAIKEHARELGAVGPEIKARVDGAQQAAKRRAKDLADERKLNQEALKQLNKDLEVFSKAIGE